jgi:hypothetical protein
MRARAILSSDPDEQLKGLGKLNVWSYVTSATFACLGPVLVTHSIGWWKGLGPIITILGLLEVTLNKHPECNFEKSQESIGVWDWDILKLVMPTLGISIRQGVVTTFIIVDVGVSMGRQYEQQ